METLKWIPPRCGIFAIESLLLPLAAGSAFQTRHLPLVSVQVKELVGEQLFARYDRLLLQSTLDTMADVVYCPRRGCQTPVMKDPESIIGICSCCNYAFCTFCRMTYHGVSPCRLTAG